MSLSIMVCVCLGPRLRVRVRSTHTPYSPCQGLPPDWRNLSLKANPPLTALVYVSKTVKAAGNGTVPYTRVTGPGFPSPSR